MIVRYFKSSVLHRVIPFEATLMPYNYFLKYFLNIFLNASHAS